MGISRRNGGYIGLKNQSANRGMYDLFTGHANKTSTVFDTGPVNCTYYLDRNGATIGNLNVYLVDESGNKLTSAVQTVNGGNISESWLARNFTIDNPGQSYHVAWHYVSSSDFTGDIAIDTVSIDGNSYNFDAGSDGFVTTSGVDTADSATALLNSVVVPTASDSILGRWNRHTGTVSSTGTGPSGAHAGSYYLHAETTNPNYPGINMWLFSPLIGG